MMINKIDEKTKLSKRAGEVLNSIIARARTEQFKKRMITENTD